MYIMKKLTEKDPMTSLEEGRKECELHIEIMEELKSLKCHIESSWEEDYEGYPYCSYRLLENKLTDERAIMIARRQKHDEILLMIQKYGEMYAVVSQYNRYSYSSRSLVLPVEVQVIIAERNNPEEMKAFLAYMGFGEEGQNVVISRGKHDELMYYIERHGFTPEMQKKLWQRGNMEEIALHFHKHCFCPELISKWFRLYQNHQDILFAIHWYGEQHKTLPEDVQVMIAQRNNPEETEAFLSYMGFGEKGQSIVIGRGNHDELMSYIRRHGFTPKMQKMLWQRGNMEEIALHLQKHGLCKDLTALLLDNGNPEYFDLWISQRALPFEKQKALLETGSSELFYKYIRKYKFDYQLLSLLFDKRSLQEAKDYISLYPDMYRLDLFLKNGKDELVMHLIRHYPAERLHSLIEMYQSSGRNKVDEMLALTDRCRWSSYTTTVRKSLIKSGNAEDFKKCLTERFSPEEEKFLVQEGSHDIVMAYIDRYPLEMYALREFYNRNNPEEAVFYQQRWS